ncbi:hypothetical protein ABEB36_015706 [Hypothenemus hampei]|uniref:Uncharacterized protein n=1 Tax=Hypothenemus hampei TaxID=57062 RepID=A0ABD1DYY6_HYPHA
MPKMGICLVCGCSENEVEKCITFRRTQKNQGSGRKIWEFSLLALLYETKPTLHSSQASNLTNISIRNTCMTSHANEVQLFPGVPEVVNGDERIPLQQEIISDFNTESKPESSHVKTSKRSYFKGIAYLEKRTASPRKLKLMEMVVRKEDHIRKLKYLCKRRVHDIKALSVNITVIIYFGIKRFFSNGH